MADNFKSDYFNMPVHVSIYLLGHFGEYKNLSDSKAFALLFKNFHYFVESRDSIKKMIEHQI